MAPKGGNRPNPKVEAALERKAVVEAEKEAKKAAEEEAAEARAWKIGSNTRAASREATAAEKHAEKMKNEAEKKAALEADEIDNAGVPKPRKVKVKKKDDVSALLMAGLENSKTGKAKKKNNNGATANKKASEEAEKRKIQQEALEKSAKAKGIVMQDHRNEISQNPNRPLDDEVETATNIDGAIEVLSGTKGLPRTQSSKNLKVLYSAFEAKTIPMLKEENPGLKQSQYKDRCFALWQKSPENPKNQDGI